MIHLGRLSNVPLMFEMAGTTLLYVGMKSRRLTLQERFLRSVAKNALHRIHPQNRGMAGCTILFQRCMNNG